MMQRPLVTSLVCLGLAAGSTALAASAMPRAPQAAHLGRTAAATCPAYAGGTGILDDGDFSQAADPGNGLRTVWVPDVFAPRWRVSRSNIDLYGSTAWNGGPGYCSVDMDGSHRGAVRHVPFATIPHETYSVTFLLSANGSTNCGRGGTAEKVLLIDAAGSAQLFTWNTADGNDAQHGVWVAESWSFQAYQRSTELHFRSLDHKHSACGPVIAAVSVTKD